MEQRRINSLLSVTAYPEPTGSVSLIQTHVSWIFVTDRFVYKIKKPVDFGFLNFTTLDRRRFYCEEEVRLNRRLCPDIYLGVADLRETPDGVRFGGEGKVVDYAVRMKRLPEERMLHRLLDEGKVTDENIREIARTIALFHLTAERGEEIDRCGEIDAITRNWNENFSQGAAFIGITASEGDFHLIREWVTSFIAEHRALFASRVAGGFIRDCDGDIHSENICLAERVYIFDCIEFNNRFRYSDTAADIAFLLMDLDYHRAGRFAQLFLDEYISVTGDSRVVELLDFYKTYRAFVRGKVESFRLRDPAIPDAEKEAARERAGRYFRLARGYVLRRRLPPALIITCGLTGSGKSVIASELSFELGLEVCRSDVLRKELAGIPISERRLESYDTGLYSPSFTRATYAELLRRGEEALKSGRGIIIDASFRRNADRRLFRALADRFSAPFFIVHTTCPEDVIRERLDARMARADEPSDGRWEIFQRQREEFEPLDGDREDEIIVDTTGEIRATMDKILKLLGIL